MAKLGTGLDEHEVVLLRLILALLCGDFALVVQICLVANEDDDYIVAPLRPDVIYPFPGVLEGLGICSALTVSSKHLLCADGCVGRRSERVLVLEISYTTTATLESRI